MLPGARRPRGAASHRSGGGDQLKRRWRTKRSREEAGRRCLETSRTAVPTPSGRAGPSRPNRSHPRTTRRSNGGGGGRGSCTGGRSVRRMQSGGIRAATPELCEPPGLVHIFKIEPHPQPLHHPLRHLHALNLPRRQGQGASCRHPAATPARPAPAAAPAAPLAAPRWRSRASPSAPVACAGSRVCAQGYH